MKTITVGNNTFEYAILIDDSEYGSSIYTEFYNGTRTYWERKYILFGKKRLITEPKIAFTLNFNIEDASLTKKFVRQEVEKVVEHYLGLLNRKEEIANGEII